MSHAYPIEIITIYNAALTSSAKARYRVLGLVSLIVAGLWLWAAGMQIHPWLSEKIALAALNEVMAAGSLGPSSGQPPTASEIEALDVQLAQSKQRGAVLAGTTAAWYVCTFGAGAWLALAAMTGIAGWRGSLRMQRQAAWLILLATLSTAGGIWAAIRWGGMPPHADARLYATIIAIQSAYAWVLFVATRLVR